MDFARSVEYLLSLGNEVSAMKLGLENIRTLLDALGNPQQKYLKIQVAGTNGKGSVCAFLDSICNTAGIATGTYTSPHLISITERVRINGVDITEREFARVANLVRETSETLLSEDRLEYRPTFFEQITAIALVAFAGAKVEVAILETGLGGRLDATTAANAEIAAITRIDLDHQEYLGETIEEIAAEKAAIIRPGSKVILSHQTRSVEQVLLGRCREVEVEPVWASTDIGFNRIPDTSVLSGSITTERDHYHNLEPWYMVGRHQFENAAIAISIAEILNDFRLAITTDEICLGIDRAKHPGRLEYVDSLYLLDGAHNVSGARALREFLDEFETRPITMIFGAMQGKDVSGMASYLFPGVETLIFTRPSNSRAMNTDDLFSSIPIGVDIRQVISTESVKDAVAAADARTAASGLILVTGSLYLVGEVRKLLQEKATLEI